MPPERLSAAQARRIAIAGTGLARPRPDTPGPRHVATAVARLGLLQIDSVSVLARAHYLPLFSRLGPYDRALLDRAAWGTPRRLFEYWAHEASLLPLPAQPLLRWRMQQAAAGHAMYGELARFGVEHRDWVRSVLAEVRRRGPTTASELEGAPGVGGWWGWSQPKRALEWLFWAGELTTATRRGSFERVYDLPDRVLPRAVLDTPTPEPMDARRALLAIAARALGVATAGDLRDYFRLSPDEAAPALAALVEQGTLLPVQVDGWKQAAYLHAEAALPRRVAARALLAPFDPLIWHRPRTQRLFGFEYRLEIYTPAHRRQHGYYVLPFLLGDRLVARLDLKTDRAAGALRVQAAHEEPSPPDGLPDALAAELTDMARWLGLARVEVHGATGLSARLRPLVPAG